MFEKIKPEWRDFFEAHNLLDKIANIIDVAYATNDALPPKDSVLALFEQCTPESLKVVIIGQDPYHTPLVADGLAFSTKQPKTPPSLKNIFKELHHDLGITRTNNDLSDWVNQGVFLINTSWTVKTGIPDSHQDLGWSEIVSEILIALANNNLNLIFCLWGKRAKNLYNKLCILNKNVIESPHPSPFSANRGFLGSKPFSKINDLIIKDNLGKIINW